MADSRTRSLFHPRARPLFIFPAVSFYGKGTQSSTWFIFTPACDIAEPFHLHTQGRTFLFARLLLLPLHPYAPPVSSMRTGASNKKGGGMRPKLTCGFGRGPVDVQEHWVRNTSARSASLCSQLAPPLSLFATSLFRLSHPTAKRLFPRTARAKSRDRTSFHAFLLHHHLRWESAHPHRHFPSPRLQLADNPTSDMLSPLADAHPLWMGSL